MPTFVIERDIAGIGQASADELRAISQKSCGVLDRLGSGVEWKHSYVTPDRIYCVYLADSEELVREHARLGGFPANTVSLTIRALTHRAALGDRSSLDLASSLVDPVENPSLSDLVRRMTAQDYGRAMPPCTPIRSPVT